MNLPILAVTSGEPAGIGPDVCLGLAEHTLPCRPVILADRNLLASRAAQLGKSVRLRDFAPHKRAEAGTLEVLHIPLAAPCEAGRLNAANAPYVLQLLDAAYGGIVRGEFAAMVTAPLHKGIINEATGAFFSGHTEYLAEKSGTDRVVMMLAGGGLRVALVTTHLPLKDVAAAVTFDAVCETARILHRDLRGKFKIAAPRILVAGLNPHAGEGGHLGHEENDVIIPALGKLRGEGLDVRGPYPADTLFQPFMLKDADAVLAMYHDQGLPVLKYASFGRGVNITLGLPFVRTSVDHGTALDLAGTGRADGGSLIEAVRTALAMVG
ncbi:4-hydroxythreonine-4-phosphate dehydrogenase PdxA [Neisseria sp. 23W00296]|uniref:4-hydroxythreonine-4-phosphate dehydrogenase PdxA n=1 Tax=unclassified Neisseria TaxID=2623750 RepID=UPI0002A28CF4|nr:MULTISPECIES: 4-hydroxythreonine-4-phosphate dehydrogenase PdxA [unclassified Neisseria]ASP17233.1 4-hydroxythreonine-4-phosphate dehydrogenase PdxA [Neisseria sp. KEM232]EKY07199.1 4-hydroxythreonine-4-phosphate dehydrogenase [Neisseria sp. oral taxon 020 str. F0370]